MMHSVFRKIITTYTAATVACMVIIAVFWSGAFRRERYHELEQVLSARATILCEIVRDDLLSGRISNVDDRLQQLGKTTGTRITLIAADGRPLFDSLENAASMDNHADRPEVVDSVKTGSGRSIRLSPTLRQEMMYCCRAIHGADGSLAGHIRLAFSTAEISRQIRGAYAAIWLACGAGIALSLLTGIVLIRKITRPLSILRESAERLKTGDLDSPVRSGGGDEISAVADSLEGMRLSLRSTLARYDEAAGRLRAVIAGMPGGVVVVDEHDTIVLVNEEAARLLRFPAETAGRQLGEIARSNELLDLMQESLQDNCPVIGEVTLPGPQERLIETRVSPVYDASHSLRGSVAMLIDVTELKRLEQIRSDFVANVSHELKSPLTSIRGFVETLRDGAYRDEKDCLHFIGILDRESQRLETLLNDLLLLSEIEARKSTISKAPVNLNELARQAAHDFSLIAGDRNVQIDLNLSPDDIIIDADAHLLGQAIGNLVDNAIKYNQAGGAVTIATVAANSSVVVKVSDTGIGIPSKDLPRIFERFYRVDKSHSRRVGGTGLGLSIAKHIIAAHNGTISAESELGKGSVFTIVLPIS